VKLPRSSQHFALVGGLIDLVERVAETAAGLDRPPGRAILCRRAEPSTALGTASEASE
jgi:hypothetical protein